MTRCLAPDCRMGGVGCDNMTVIIVCLLQGQSYSELSRKCARPSTSAAWSLSRERSVNDMVDGDEDEEWYDCADDLVVTASTVNDNDHETTAVVKQDDNDEMKLEGDETRCESEEMEHEGEEDRGKNEELRLDDGVLRLDDGELRLDDGELRLDDGEMKDEEVVCEEEEVKHEDEGVRQEEEKETRDDEDLELMEVVTSTQAQEDTEEQDGVATLPLVEEVNDTLFSNGDHDNQTMSNKQANSLQHIVFKSTAV